MHLGAAVLFLVLCRGLVDAFLLSSNVAKSDVRLDSALQLTKRHKRRTNKDRKRAPVVDLERQDKRANKVKDRWMECCSKQKDGMVLVVDGNNLRGTTNFDWSMPQVMESIDEMVGQWNDSENITTIHGAVVMWDHGTCPSVSLYGSHTMAIFSGLTRRADDVMVHELPTILECLGGSVEQKKNHAEAFSSSFWDFSSLVCVTNDSGLRDRLRRLSMRPSGTRISATNLFEWNQKVPTMIDSTSFVDYLRHFVIEGQAEWTLRHAWPSSLHTTNALLLFFAQVLNQKHNARREKTWQRCVMTQALQQDLNRMPINEEVSSYCKNLMKKLVDEGRYEGLRDESSEQVAGSTRLDRRQRKILGKFNKFDSLVDV